MFIGCYAILAQFRPITWQPLVYGSLGLAAIQVLIYKTTYRKRPDVLPITMLYFQMASILSMIFIGNLAPFEEAMLIPLSGPVRNELAETLLRYIEFHSEATVNVKSLKVLRELFQ